MKSETEELDELIDLIKTRNLKRRQIEGSDLNEKEMKS